MSKKYLRFKDHIYHVFTPLCLIILDINNDEYTFFSDTDSNFLNKIMNSSLQNHIINRKIIKKLLALNICYMSNHKQKINISDDTKKGIGNYQWRLVPTLSKKVAFSFQNIKIFLHYMSIYIPIKLFGIKYIVKKIKAMKNSKESREKLNHIMQAQGNTRINIIANNIRNITKLLPFSTACLITSYLLYYELYRQYDVTFCIGIQQDPFLSHAWINHKGIPVLENEHLNDKMIKMLEL